MCDELMVAVRAAQKAAALVRSYSIERDTLGVRNKQKFDLVTNADIASEECIRSVIMEQFPDDVFLGEETSPSEMSRSGRRWIVDPIDGTVNFAHGLPPYCVSIAFYDGDEPCVGVVLEVFRDELFIAEKGKGAHLNGKKITVSETELPELALVATGFPVTDGIDYSDMLRMADAMLRQTQGIRRPGSAAFDLCALAAGRIDAYYETSLKPWDLASGALIVREAGGQISDMTGGGQWLHGRSLAATNGKLHTWLLQSLAQHAPAMASTIIHN